MASALRRSSLRCQRVRAHVAPPPRAADTSLKGSNATHFEAARRGDHGTLEYLITKYRDTVLQPVIRAYDADHPKQLEEALKAGC